MNNVNIMFGRKIRISKQNDDVILYTDREKV